MGMAGAVLEDNATDEQLVTAVRRGDDRAFEALYGRYQRRITAYVMSMVKDHGRAEDVTQEVFVSALRRMRATERPIAFKPWVYEIARNACIDQFRRTRRTDEVSFDADDGAAFARDASLVSSTTPDAALDAKQHIDDLMGAFGGLSDSHHDILVMRELEGRSYREIGERLGMSGPSVESTLFRARRRLTEEYDELVSGERCRRVGELLAVGVESLGTRDERRLARHVAHCQPCRRSAYAAGVDAAVLTRSRRREAGRRIAALFPVPAFLRWSQTVSPVAEPAAGWSKALAAAAVIVAGGAGMAGHGHGGAPAPVKPAAVATPAITVTKATAVARRHQRIVAGPAKRTHKPRTTKVTHVRTHPATGGGTPGARPALQTPSTTPPSVPATPAKVATPPSASSVGAEPPKAPAKVTTPATAPTPAPPIAGDALHGIENVATQASGPAGRALTDTGASLGLGG